MPYKKNVTMIDDLPDLDQQPAAAQGAPSSMYMNNFDDANRPKNLDFVNKFIRDTHNGMQKYDDANNLTQLNQAIHHSVNPQVFQQMHNQPEMIEENVRISIPKYREIHCVDIIDHIKECPVCSKIHNTNEKTIYIVIIVVLVIICAFLLKRIVDS